MRCFIYATWLAVLVAGLGSETTAEGQISFGVQVALAEYLAPAEQHSP
jgi:hypothetical protein